MALLDQTLSITVSEVNPGKTSQLMLHGNEERTSTAFVYPDAMALIATVPQGSDERQIGVARYARTEASEIADFAVVVADEWQGQGLGRELLGRILRIAEHAGVKSLQSPVLRENVEMIRLAKRFGFYIELCQANASLTLIRKDLSSDQLSPL